MNHELLENTRPRKWKQMSVERRQELEILSKVDYSKLLSIIILQKKMKDSI
jgi:hypothetical protein